MLLVIFLMACWISNLLKFLNYVYGPPQTTENDVAEASGRVQGNLSAAGKMGSVRVKHYGRWSDEGPQDGRRQQPHGQRHVLRKDWPGEAQAINLGQQQHQDQKRSEKQLLPLLGQEQGRQQERQQEHRQEHQQERQQVHQHVRQQLRQQERQQAQDQGRQQAQEQEHQQVQEGRQQAQEQERQQAQGQERQQTQEQERQQAYELERKQAQEQDRGAVPTRHPHYRLALTVPWIGKTFPSWFPYFLASARRSSFLVDWLVFHEGAVCNASDCAEVMPSNVILTDLGKGGLGLLFGTKLARAIGSDVSESNLVALFQQAQSACCSHSAGVGKSWHAHTFMNWLGLYNELVQIQIQSIPTYPIPTYSIPSCTPCSVSSAGVP